ncbi:MAG TPA: hypothetical protein HPP83_06020 [Candidatus Hydrogenedentes bacterium]|nr:hypothetical protein [Candidatus Hydrogenedentota bacterium]
MPRFKVHCETEGVIYVVDGADGQEKPVWTAWKVDGSFDGNQGMALEYGPGKDGKPTLGKILNDQPLHVQTPLLNRKLEQTLYFYGGKGLTTFLDEIPPELPPWEVLPPEDPDILRIWHPDPKAALNDEFEEWSFVLLLDMSRGTNIVRRERWSNYGEPNAFLCNVTEDVVLTRFDDVWLPVSQQYKTCHLDATGQRMVSTVTLTSTFQWSAVNEPISADTFRIDFPPGCFIEDDVRGMSYRAGVTAHEHLQQVEQAVAELETMRARDRSREEGASSSTSSSGLNVVPRVDQAERRHHHRYIGFAVAVCLVLLAGALAIRGSRRRCREHHARQE